MPSSACLHPSDVLELHLGALVCGGVLYGEDDVFVVKLLAVVLITLSVATCTFCHQASVRIVVVDLLY